MKKYLHLILHVFVPVLFGALIYILFRKESLTVFIWIGNISLLDEVMFIRSLLSDTKKNIPNLILYSLPDGIWVYSATYLLIEIWKNNLKNIYAWFWISIPLICSVVIELLQLFQVVEGSYCLYDMTFYFSFFILSLLTINYRGLHAIKK